MPDEFPYDVFLSHSAKDKALVRPLAERLRADGVKVWFDEWVLLKDEIRRLKAESEPHPSSFILHPLVESGTFRFRDPLNKERRFLPPRLDDAAIKSSDWFRKDDDVRWQFGVPPKGNANFAWVQHFIHHLAPVGPGTAGGMAGFVLANGSMSSNQSGEGDTRCAGRNFCPGRTSPFSPN